MLVDVIDFRPDLPLEKTLGKNVAVIDVLRCTSCIAGACSRF